MTDYSDPLAYWIMSILGQFDMYPFERRNNRQSRQMIHPQLCFKLTKSFDGTAYSVLDQWDNHAYILPIALTLEPTFDVRIWYWKHQYFTYLIGESPDYLEQYFEESMFWIDQHLEPGFEIYFEPSLFDAQIKLPSSTTVDSEMQKAAETLLLLKHHNDELELCVKNIKEIMGDIDSESEFSDSEFSKDHNSPNKTDCQQAHRQMFQFSSAYNMQSPLMQILVPKQIGTKLPPSNSKDY